MRRTYFESPIVMTTVRLVAPFALTYGAFVTLHGAESPGGGFQGGVVVAATVITVAFAFGVRPTVDWVDERVVVGVFAGGMLAFGAVTVGTVLLGGAVLQVDLLPVSIKYGIEAVEVFIGAIVAGVVTSLFFLLSEGGDGE
ncbi:MAG: multicomponent Na+:H+ antiporter subunit B [Methanobacteriota archaeon]|jgi:multicomponent Na+:H+ antiporter subunit B|uniref:Cation:proton antiporter n=1 Tax=Halorutilus salinus TaxID=2487751 RepID=A0A9Q4C3T0_9EURY|nr:MnhB domain-containing protein [Halorutilus salinus]MCX2819342.1 cation:proton antiporter [Halorutilus salinus]